MEMLQEEINDAWRLKKSLTNGQNELDYNFPRHLARCGYISQSEDEVEIDFSSNERSDLGSEEECERFSEMLDYDNKNTSDDVYDGSYHVSDMDEKTHNNHECECEWSTPANDNGEWRTWNWNDNHDWGKSNNNCVYCDVLLLTQELELIHQDIRWGKRNACNLGDKMFRHTRRNPQIVIIVYCFNRN